MQVHLVGILLLSLSVCCSTLLSPTRLLAQQADALSPKEAAPPAAEKGMPDDPSAASSAALVPPPPLPLSEKEKEALCRQWTGRYVSYYSKVFFITKGCKRYELEVETLAQLTRQGIHIHEVDGQAMQALSFGGSFERDLRARQQPQVDPCKKYHHQYVTADMGIFWVEGNCEKRPFLDWDSYAHHRGKLQAGKTRLHSISPGELMKLKEGSPMPSVIDEEARELSDTIDVLPIDEACQGLIGQYVTYFGNIYYIQALPEQKLGILQCHKRPVDGETYTRLYGQGNSPLKELNSSQFISIPDGQAMPLAKE